MIGIQGMITSLKNNNRREKREPFKTISDYAGYGIDQSKTSGLMLKKVTKEQLEAIRKRLTKERKVLFWKRVIAAILIPIGLISLFIILK